MDSSSVIDTVRCEVVCPHLQHNCMATKACQTGLLVREAHIITGNVRILLKEVAGYIVCYTSSTNSVVIYYK